MGLGPYPEVSLAEARDKARELRKQIRNGIDPLQKNTPIKRIRNVWRTRTNPSQAVLKTLSQLRPKS